MKKKRITLTTVEDVHTALKLAGIKRATGQGSNFITNSKASGCFPAKYAIVLRKAANKAGYDIADSAFNFAQVQEPAE